MGWGEWIALVLLQSSPTKQWFTQTFYMVHSLIFNSSSVMSINISCPRRKTLEIYKFPSRKKKKKGQIEIANDKYELMLQTMTFKSDLLFDPKFVPWYKRQGFPSFRSFVSNRSLFVPGLYIDCLLLDSSFLSPGHGCPSYRDPIWVFFLKGLFWPCEYHSHTVH